MGFGPMDGFFLAVFLAVCILVAVLLRCLCYRFCMKSCTGKFRHGNDEAILPRHTTPTITPARTPRTQEQNSQRTRTSQSRRVPQLPPSGTVFTIYTFPQQQSPELQRAPRVSGPPKYSTVPADSPPKYEDLFPLNINKNNSPSVSSSSTTFEMQLTSQTFTELHSIPEESSLSQSPSSSSICSSGNSSAQTVPSSASLSANSSQVSVPSEGVPSPVPKEAPPLYDTIYPPKSGE